MDIRPPHKVELDTQWKLLIIDDDEDDYLIVRDMLAEARGQKIELQWAAAYEAGREALFSNQYHAVLVDYDLGLHSGIHLIREASERGYAAPLILFTGRGSYDVDVEAMQAGATMYITKGEVNPRLLERSIRYAIELKQKEASLRASEAHLRASEAQLRASEQKFRALFENSQDAIFLSQPGGTVESANPAACAMLGWSEQELCQIGRSAVLDESDPRLAPALQERQRIGHIKAQELTAIRKDGERFPVEVSSVILPSEPVRSFVIMRDITERKRAEEALRISEEKFAKAFRASPLALAISTPEEGKFVEINDSFTELYGYSRDEVIGHTSLELGILLPEDRKEFIEKFRQGRGSRNFELRARAKSGEIRNILISTEPIEIDGKEHMLSVTMNISERRETDNRIRQLNQILLQRNIELDNERARWQGVVEGIADEVWLCDPQGKMSLMNLPDKTAMGLEEFQDWPYEKVLEELEILNPDGQPRPFEQAPLLRAIKGEIVRGEEIMRQRSSGKTRYRQYSAAPTRDSHGAINGAVAIVHDVTKLKAAEMALRESETTLREREAALIKSEGRLRDFLENTHDSFFVLDKGWRFQYVNRRFAEIVHHAPSELLGQVIWEVFPGYLGTPVEQHYRKAMEERISIHYEMGGFYSTAWYEITVYPSQEGVAVFSVDRSEEKKAREALHESQERLERAQQIAHLGSWELDLLHDRLSWSDEVYRIFGLQPGEFSATYEAFLDHIHPEDRAAVDEAYSSSLRENRDGYEIEHRVIRKSKGEIRFVHEKCEHFRDASGQIIRSFGMIHDITERKQVMDDLHAALDRAAWLARFPDENPNPVARVTADGRLLYKNMAAAEMDGWLCEKNQIVPDVIQDLVRRAMERGEETEQEAQVCGRLYSLSVMPFPSDGYVNLYGRDITESRRAERALRESETRFHQLADAMPQLVWTALPDGTIDYINQRQQEYDGFIFTEGRGWDWSGAVHPDDLFTLLETWNRVIKTGEFRQMEIRIRTSYGGYRWHLARGIPIKDSQGNVIRWFGTNTDIEDQKRTEDQLRRSNEELEQFAFVASHDLQEPLRKIRMFGSLIQANLKGKLDAGTQDYFERMMSASERMQGMIQDLLELSRVNTQGRPFMPVDLALVVAEVISDLEPRILRTGGKVQVGELPVIDADPIQIHQIFQNLIGNGLKFHKPDIPPIVTVSAVKAKSSASKGERISIQVQDNGIGFEEQQFERILQPFQRLHGRSEYEGTGIGLAIVKKIVDRHLGEISAQSAPGEGSTFIVTLPAKQND